MIIAPYLSIDIVSDKIDNSSKDCIYVIFHLVSHCYGIGLLINQLTSIFQGETLPISLFAIITPKLLNPQKEHSETYRLHLHGAKAVKRSCIIKYQPRSYKIIFNVVNLNVGNIFIIIANKITRGHPFTLIKPLCKTGKRAFAATFFCSQRYRSIEQPRNCT